jgi:hypothetical protein
MVQREFAVASVHADSELSPRYRKALVCLLADMARAGCSRPIRGGAMIGGEIL